MLVPTFDDNVGIFINHRFNLTEVIRFDALLLSENELHTIPLELGAMPPLPSTWMCIGSCRRIGVGVG